jgi:hypothetical protein
MTRGVRFVSVERPARKEPLPLTMCRGFAERAEVELSEVECVLHQAADAMVALGGLASQLPPAEFEALGTLLSRGLRDVAEKEGKTLGELSLYLRLELGRGQPHPDDPRPGATEGGEE